MIARLPGLDATVRLLRRGYPFVAEECDGLGADAFRTRLLGKSVVCARGADAARAFYTPNRFTRRDAMPASTVHLLQDLGSVQTLDGLAHRHRKELFLSTIPQHDATALTAAFREEFLRAADDWPGRPRIVLLHESERLLAATALRWVGLPADDAEITARTTELAAMVGAAGSVGPAHWRARLLRRRSERWATERIADVRAGRSPAPDGAPLRELAEHHDIDGEPLEARVAGVELLNLLRPLVAVARFIAFAALALVRHPGWREAFAAGEHADLIGFVQEVRRLYPFFPLIGGRALEPFRWCDHDFSVGDWMVLDLYGTNHDPRSWPAPEEFHPERFRAWDGDPNTLIAQGGGEVTTGHRCPGENATIALLAEAVRLLTGSIRYEVPVQDLHVDLRRMPAQPHDGLVITGVRRT